MVQFPPMATLHAVLATVSDRPGMLFGLSRVLADHQANIRYVDMHATGDRAEVYLEFSLEVDAAPVIATLRQVEGVTRLEETPSFGKIYGKRIIIMGGGAQVGQVALGAISEADRHNIRGERISVDTIPLVGEQELAAAVRAVMRLPRVRILVLAGSLMGGSITRAVEEIRQNGVYVISLNMAGSVPDAADLVVSDPIQAGVMAVMAIADTAKFDLIRQQKRRYWARLPRSGAGRETGHVGALFRPEPGRIAGLGIHAHVLHAPGRRNRDMAPGVAEHPLQQRLRPGRHPERRERGQRARAQWPQEVPLRERPHHDHAEAQVGSRRQDLPLDVALPRVVGDLDRVDTRITHRLTELGECLRAVVRQTDETDASLAFQCVQRGKTGPPLDQVVHLIHIDVPAEPRECAGDLPVGFTVARRPDLGRDDRTFPLPFERLSEYFLGPPVHRGRVEQGGAGIERRRGDRLTPLHVGAVHIERHPRPHPDDGDMERRAAESALLHGRLLPHHDPEVESSGCTFSESPAAFARTPSTRACSAPRKP
jgi:energy-converting hydrogenase B subunit Q